MKKETLQLAALIQMRVDKPEELVKLAKHYNRLEETAKVAQERYTESHQDNGKVIHVLRSEWVTEREKPGAKILTSSTYPEHHEAITGGKPTKRGYQCAIVFGLLVVQAKSITEQDYDFCPCEYITLTSEIAGKCNNDPAHPALVEAAAILKSRPKSAIKDLKAIKARFVEATEGEGDDEKKVTKFLSPEEAAAAADTAAKGNVLDLQTALDTMLKNGQCGAILAAILAHARTTENEKDVQSIVHMVCQTRGALAENKNPEGVRRFDDDKLESFRAEVEAPVTKDLAFYEAQYKDARRAQSEVEGMFADAGKPELIEQWTAEVDAETAATEAAPAQ